MGRVFVSYAKADQAVADEIVAELEAHGIACWIAPRDVAPSADWAAEIVDAISTASLMVLVFSAHSCESGHVLREVERAVHRNVGILPFRIEDVLPSKSLEYFLSSRHWMDAFAGDRRAHYAALRRYLEASLAGPSQNTGPALNAGAAAARGAGLGPAELEALQERLAEHVGPVARHLVRRHLPRAASASDLIALLAEEIAVPADRARFLDRCRLA